MSTIGRIRGKAPGISVPGYSLNKKVSDEQIKEYIIQIIEDVGHHGCGGSMSRADRE